MLNFFGLATLTSDIELEDVGNTKVAKFSVAVNEYFGTGDQRKENSYFFNCEAWDTGAERLAANGKKGNKVYLKGVLRQDRWPDKETGKQREKVKLRVLEFYVIPRVPKEESKD